MDSSFDGPAQVGFQNINGKCWVSSLVQAIYACKPLLRKVLTVQCPNALVTQLKIALQLLSKRKPVVTESGGAILVEEVRLLYNEVFDATKTHRESNLGEATNFLKELNIIYNGCGFDNSFFNYYKFVYPFILIEGKKNDINVLIQEQQADILNRLTVNPEFIIFGCFYGVTHITRQISIGPYRFQICAIIIGTGGHFYTITNDGRYDDSKVNKDPHIMERYIRDGFDFNSEKPRQANGHLFFFERIGGAASPGLPPPPPPSFCHHNNFHQMSHPPL